MSANGNNRKIDFVRLIMSDIRTVSTDPELSKEFLEGEGLNVSQMQADGLKRIKKMQLMLAAGQTKSEMKKADSVSARATAFVEKLLADTSFSFANFIRQEEVSLSYRSFEANSPDDIKAILIKHYTLKMMNEDDQADTENV